MGLGWPDSGQTKNENFNLDLVLTLSVLVSKYQPVNLAKTRSNHVIQTQAVVLRIYCYL